MIKWSRIRHKVTLSKFILNRNSRQIASISRQYEHQSIDFLESIDRFWNQSTDFLKQSTDSPEFKPMKQSTLSMHSRQWSESVDRFMPNSRLISTNSNPHSLPSFGPYFCRQTEESVDRFKAISRQIAPHLSTDWAPELKMQNFTPMLNATIPCLRTHLTLTNTNA